MALLVTDCPHCTAAHVTMKDVAVIQREHPSLVNAFLVCPICRKPVGAWFIGPTRETIDRSTLHDYPHTFEEAGWILQEMWPPIAAGTAPDDVPSGIARPFIQAEEAAKRGHRETAGMAYRRALELTMKDKAPDLTGTLHKRIERFAATGGLTKDVADWAHSVRELGNEAAHDEGEPSEQDIQDLAAFTRVFLEYLYTMPAKVARRAPPAPMP